MTFNPEAKCSPTSTECPRCKNNVKLCDGELKPNFLVEEVAKFQAVQDILDLLNKMTLEELKAVLMYLNVSNAWGYDDQPTVSRDKPRNECPCWKCIDARGGMTFEHQWMVLCPICGNKRCPHANDHNNACTNSNEPGQPGSAYADQKPQ